LPALIESCGMGWIIRKFLKLIFLILIFPVCPGFAGPGNASLLLIDSEGIPVPVQNDLPYPSFELQDRKMILLNGLWKAQFAKQQMDHSLSLQKRTPDAVRKIETESKGRFKTTYDDSSWTAQAVPLPNNFTNSYEDGMWYRCRFRSDTVQGSGLVKLIFQGVNYIADVWLNGKWLGSHEGGFTPFLFNVTGLLKTNEENVLAVRVDNIPWEKMGEKETPEKILTVPYAPCDWWNYGGIYRDVYLEKVNEAYIVRSDVRLQPSGGNKGRGDITVVLHNSGSRPRVMKLSFTVFGTKITPENISSPRVSDIMDVSSVQDFKVSLLPDSVVLQPGEIKAVRCDVQLNNVSYWTPDNPSLYVLETSLLEDKVLQEKFTSQFGIREITPAPGGRGFTLNRKKIFFNGIARHEDYPGTGRALSFNDGAKILGDFQLAKDLNANFVRTAHYPNHPLTYLITDRLGIAVMEEIPVFWFGGPAFEIQRQVRGIARQMWLEMIYRDMNRPSILFWSTCNECSWQDERRAFIWDLMQNEINCDGTRLVGQSSSGSDPQDPSSIDADYHGATMYHGVFYNGDAYKDTLDGVRKYQDYYMDKPFIATEYGIWSQEDLSMTARQDEIALKTYRALTDVKADRVGGLVWWCLFDWYTRGGLKWSVQTMGAMDMRRQNIKPVFLTLQKLYSKSSGKGVKISIQNITDHAVLKGNLNTSVQIATPTDLGIKNAQFRFANTVFSSLAVQNDAAQVDFDLKKLPEGPNALIIRALLSNGDCFYERKDIVVDNVDDPPVVELKIRNNKHFLGKIPLVFKAYDDRTSDLKVTYSLDGQSAENLLQVNSLYRSDIDISKLPDNSSHALRISVSDGVNPAVIENLDFVVDNSPGNKVDLAYTIDRISTKNNRSDASGWSFPAEELPDSDSWFICQGDDNVKFWLGSKEDGRKNAMECKGQKLKVTPGHYKTIDFLGTSYWGDLDNKLTLVYSDGSSETKELNFSDWVGANSTKPQEHVGILTSCYYSVEKVGDQPLAMYHRTVSCNPAKILQAIKLPNDERKHIFALSVE
jgi:beta-galactosidase